MNSPKGTYCPDTSDGKNLIMIEDVSYMTDEEYAECMDTPFNSIENALIDATLKTGKKLMDKSMGIGSHIAQIAGVVYPYRIDNYCKIVKGIKGYARYMDDFYIIHKSKEFLWELMSELKKLCAELGLFLNERKTQIVSLHHPFTILKTQYRLLPDGRIIRKPDKSQRIRTCRKLKAMKAKLDEGTITLDKVEQIYKSTRGQLARYGETESVRSFDEFYNNLLKIKIKI